MDKKHIVFIINPKSGIDRQKSIADVVDATLDKQRFSVDIVYTQYAKHGTLLAKEAAENGAYAVIAVGGDGSVNDVVAGLLGTGAALGIIPKGSGNGMARTFGIPLNVEKAIAVINKTNLASVDIGFADGKPFISNAGTAFDALIAQKFAGSTRRGLLMYSWLVLKYMWAYKEPAWKIVIDGKEITQRAFIVNVANGQQFGYNFKIAPQADYTDGVFDIIVIRKFPKILGGLLVLRALSGTITQSRYVDHYKGKEIMISNATLNTMQTDGDVHACGQAVHFTISKGMQSVLIP